MEHGIYDGIAHYVFETMAVVEPTSRYQDRRRRNKLHRADAYSTGKARGYASTVPTFTHNRYSYQYTSNTGIGADDDLEILEEVGSDEISIAPRRIAGRKKCLNCNHEFDGVDAFKVPNWENVIKSNQVDFKEGKFDILVATKGFGMGIDKSSVRFVIHTSLVLRH